MPMNYDAGKGTGQDPARISHGRRWKAPWSKSILSMGKRQVDKVPDATNPTYAGAVKALPVKPSAYTVETGKADETVAMGTVISQDPVKDTGSDGRGPSLPSTSAQGQGRR
ncbi:MAG: hypothetical protein ACLR23_04895 [Clostridia bacterium]